MSKKSLKRKVHFYFPEASNRGQRIDLCEYFYIKHSFSRRISKAKLEYYAEDHEKNFKKALNENLKKKNQELKDLFYIVFDTDINESGSNVGHVISNIIKFEKEYGDSVKIILSGRSFEVWLCMYERQNYTAPFETQEVLNKDVKEKYEKKESWYKENGERLYRDSNGAARASELSKRLVFSGTPTKPPTNLDIVKNLPEFSNAALVTYLANTTPFTYFEHVIYMLKSFE